MTSEALLQKFDALVDAPNGVQKLREMILQLAVRGKLVPQDPSDEPASVLLERIEEEKQRLFESGEIRKPKKLPPVEPDEVPFDIPRTWAWSRLASLGQINPRNKLDDSIEVSFCPMALIPECYGDPVAFEVRKWGEIKSGYTHFAENDIVTAKITPCFQNGKAAVMRDLAGGAGAGTTELYVFRPIPGTLEADYVLIFIKSPGFVDGGERRMTGTAGQQRVPRDYFEGTPVPVPPIAEQRRIVERVDQLMALCEDLEERQRRRAEIRVSVNRSALHHLTTAADNTELAVHWRRIREHFDILYDAPETVAGLRQAVLQLAVRGKLVPQDPSDEPASVLLERIEEEKQRLYESGEIRKPKKVPPISEDEVPFAVPEGWEWVRLGTVGQIIGGGTPKTGDPTLWADDGIPWLTPADLSSLDGKYIGRGKRDISPAGLEKSSAQLLPAGAVLFSSRAPIGYVAIAANPLATNQGFKSCVPYLHGMSEYIYRFLQAVGPEVERHAPGTTFKEVSGKIVGQVAIPLPPLPEQRRIVERVDQLMALCDELETALTHSRAKAEYLAASVVHHMSAA